ncbi:MAG: TldD/PmbA family protein, partial [Halocynthiibacter sp.]
MSLERLSERLLDAAKKAGADAADCLVVDGTSTSIDVLNGSLEHAERSEGVDLGLRVFVGKSQACVSASDQSADTISQMAARAVAMAKEAPEDPFARLAHDAELFHGTDVADALDLYDPNGEPDPKLLQDAALAAEEAARAVGGVTNVQSAGAGYGQTSIHLATSNGFSNGYRRSQNSLSCVAIAGKDATMERDYYGEGRIYFSDLGTAESIGTTAGTRAVERLNPQKAPAGAFPVLFDERISSSLIGHILGATNGAAIARGSSWLRDAKDTEI